MKKLLTGLLAILLALSAAACAQKADTSAEETSAPITEAEPTVTALSEEGRTIEGRAAAIREALSVPLGYKYMLNAELTVEKSGNGAKFGFCAGENPHGQILDFYCVKGGDIASHASLYGAEQRTDLGELQTAVRSPTDKMTMTVIRNGDNFYLILNGKIQQIREFVCDATAPGFYVYNATVNYTAIEYTDDAGAIDNAISEIMNEVKGYGIADGYAQFGGIEFANEGAFTYSDTLIKKGVAQSRIAFDGRYTGDMEITFKTSGLKALASADNSGDAMCRLRLLLYSENDVINMICLGVANKQDCIETFGYYDIAQWLSHSDLTGKENTYFDWSAENEFRILLTCTGRTNTFTVYVNGELAAARTVLASGPVQFGFEAENVSGTVSGFKVSGGELQ